jgi:hypothetical protein
MRWVAIALGVAGVVVAVIAVYATTVGNSRVVAELESVPRGSQAQKVMLLTLPDGRSLPVNYLREGNMVYAGSDGPWWRLLRGAGADVTLLVMGEQLRGHATAVEDDPSRTRDVFSRLRPTVPGWLPDWLNGVLVEIELQREGSKQPARP